MKTITVNLYSFDELNDTSKNKAIDHFSNINSEIIYDSVIQEADDIGLMISTFDTTYNEIKGELIEPADVVAERIMKNHGSETETAICAKNYYNEINEVRAKYNNYRAHQDADEFYEATADVVVEFEKKLLECYLVMLIRDEEYYTSDDGIAESILCNDYWFTEDGDFFPVTNKLGYLARNYLT